MIRSTVNTGEGLTVIRFIISGVPQKASTKLRGRCHQTLTSFVVPGMISHYEHDIDTIPGYTDQRLVDSIGNWESGPVFIIFTIELYLMATDNELVRLLLIFVAFLLIIPFLMMMFVWPMMGAWGGGHMWNGGMWDASGASWMWLVTWVVLLLILLGGGYLLYRALTRPAINETNAALEELRITYARGDLSDEEFDKRRERLQRD